MVCMMVRRDACRGHPLNARQNRTSWYASGHDGGEGWGALAGLKLYPTMFS